jgi:predicted dehydrogenase
MKSLVIGAGSIGKRHLRNLKTLGVQHLAVIENDLQRLQHVSQEMGIACFPAVEEGLDWSPDFVIVATPTHLHCDQALDIVRRGIDVFIEKPLCHTNDRLFDLANESEKRRLVSLVGCNMRFHPGPAKIKELLLQRQLGKILFARIHVGSYLPAWRPGTDYRENYAANPETGGGCILDCVHEIDLARWYLGEVQDVFCLAGHFSVLEISTEDIAVLLCHHSSGAISEIHLDYVQRTYERGCQIVGEKGSIFWDFNGKQVRWYDGDTARWTQFTQPQHWEVNQMYLDEMQHFLDCVRNRRQSLLPISEAVAVMQIVFAAKESARQGKLVSTTREVLA